MRFLPSRAVGAVSLSVLFALTGAQGTGAQSDRRSIESQRLFFTPEQRLVADEAVLDGATGNTDSEPVRETVSEAASKAEGKTASESARRESAPPQKENGQAPMALSAVGVESRAGSDRKVWQRATGIEFDALVTGDRGVRLLVNGLPCHAPKPVDPVDRRTAIPVDCPSLAEEQPGLVLLMISDGLQVSHGPHILGILQPGEAL